MSNREFQVRHGLIVANSFLYSSSGKLAINSSSAAVYNLDVNGTDAIKFPSGNTGQRPPAANGIIRYNSETNGFEGYSNGAWGALGGASGGGDVTNAYADVTFLKLAGGTVTGSVLPNSNSVSLGNTTGRFVIVANTGDFSGSATSSTGFYPTSNTSGTALGALAQRFNLIANTGDFSGAVAITGALTSSGGVNPSSNSTGTALGAAAARWNLNANTGDFSGAVAISGVVTLTSYIITQTGAFPFSNSSGTALGNDTLRWVITANTAAFSGAVTSSGGVNPSSNTVGTALGATTARWVLNANTGNFSGAVTMSSTLATTGAITSSGGVNPSSNTVGTALGGSTARWVVNANTGDFSGSVQILSLGIGTAASGTTGEIRATGDITSAYSDGRLKTNVEEISNALDIISGMRGVRYKASDELTKYGMKASKRTQVGVIAQEVQRVMPEVVTLAPFDIDENNESKSKENYLTVSYERLVPVLIQAIKELKKEVEELKHGS
tara:strand:- start:2649 stop:4139 length:1491 start_codon:yes stop_codon:yes gene_type:complete